MNLIEFIRAANGLDEKNLPKSTATLCLVELEETEDNQLVSNIKQSLSLIMNEITLDCFTSGSDEQGYLEVRVRFNNPYGPELKVAWDMLEVYRELFSTMNLDIEEKIDIVSDTMIELIIMPKETLETNPVFLELAFPINFTLCSSEPGKVADTIDFFFHAASCQLYENEEFDMAQIKREGDDYLKQIETENRYEEEMEEEKRRQQEEYIMLQAKMRQAAIQKVEESHTYKVGGRDKDEKRDHKS